MYTHMHECMPSGNALSTCIVVTSLFCSPSYDVKMPIPFSILWEHTFNAAWCSLVWTCGLHLAFVVGPRHRFFTVRPLPKHMGKLCLQASSAVCWGPVGWAVGVGSSERGGHLCAWPCTFLSPCQWWQLEEVGLWEPGLGSQTAAWRSPAHSRLWVRNKPLWC